MDDSVGNGLQATAQGGAEQHAESGVERRETADGSDTLFSSRYGQTFHSRHGALAEARHVFLEGSGAGARLRSGEWVSVLEVGFGTGLNFLVTAQLALECGAKLDYVGLERELLPVGALDSLDYRRFAPDAFGALLDYRRGLPERPAAGGYVAQVAGSKLELRLGEASQAEIEQQSFTAVYHDGFSPDANPELWEGRFLARLADSLVEGGVLVSYTVKGEVQRLLAAAGLEVSKAPGPPGGKREMLRAVRMREE